MFFVKLIWQNQIISIAYDFFLFFRLWLIILAMEISEKKKCNSSWKRRKTLRIISSLKIAWHKSVYDIHLGKVVKTYGCENLRLWKPTCHFDSGRSLEKCVPIIHFGKVAMLGKIECKIDFTNFFPEINLMKTTFKVNLISRFFSWNWFDIIKLVL